MTGDIANLDDHRPHVSIVDKDNAKAWVIPVAFFESLITKEKPITELEEFEQIIPLIIKDWLDDMRGER